MYTCSPSSVALECVLLEDGLGVRQGRAIVVLPITPEKRCDSVRQVVMLDVSEGQPYTTWHRRLTERISSPRTKISKELDSSCGKGWTRTISRQDTWCRCQLQNVFTYGMVWVRHSVKRTSNTGEFVKYVVIRMIFLEFARNETNILSQN